MWRLYTVGLCIGVVAALLMTFFPPDITRYTKDGRGGLIFFSDPMAKGKLGGQIQWWLSYFGPGLLGVSFILQLIALLGGRPRSEN